MLGIVDINSLFTYFGLICRVALLGVNVCVVACLFAVS